MSPPRLGVDWGRRALKTFMKSVQRVAGYLTMLSEPKCVVTRENTTTAQGGREGASQLKTVNNDLFTSHAATCSQP